MQNFGVTNKEHYGMLWSFSGVLNIATLQHPLRPRGSQSGRKKGRDERNTGETVRRLGTIIQSIICAQSGVGIRLNFWTVVR